MSSSPQIPKETTLTDRLRALMAGIIDPIVTVLARLGVSPDLLTLVGMLAHGLVAWLIYSDHIQIAGLLLVLFAPLDALDGSLARKINRPQGSFGAFFDSTLDRLAEILLFAGLLAHFAIQGNLWLVLITYLALTGSLMVSYTRSRAEALGLSCKVGILSRVERYAILVIFLLLNLPQYLVIILAIGTYITFLQRMVHVWQQTRAVQ
jgi:CDP-diacylglycerol---glycerol-3-phosphate 3-phosphatidyltransferase